MDNDYKPPEGGPPLAGVIVVVLCTAVVLYALTALLYLKVH